MVSSDKNENHSTLVKNTSPLKQFLFLRKDLENYNVGGIIAQGCHASVAACFNYLNHPETIQYLQDQSYLTTVIYEIENKDIDYLKEELSNLKIDFHVWVEDGLEVTCIATRPIDIRNYPKLKKLRKKYKLYG